MVRRVFLILFIVLFQHIAISQTYDSVMLNVGRNIAIERCYLCAGIRVKHDSSTREAFRKWYGVDSNYCITYITGYLMGDTIQKAIEHIKLHVKYDNEDFYDNSEIRIIYKFYQGKLIEAEEINPGASYTYFFKNDSLTNELGAVDDLGYFGLEANEALKYSKEDMNIIRNSEFFIKRRH